MADECQGTEVDEEKSKWDWHFMAHLEVHVVDDHHHALEPIHKAIRRRVLPFNHCAIIHFDAHADLAFPKSLAADTIFRPQELYDELDASDAGIASFLLPLVYAGHVDKLIWVKPPWATQVALKTDTFRSSSMEMSLGTQNFVVGKHITAGTLRVTSEETYFVDEDLYSPSNELTKTNSLQLTVAELPLQLTWSSQAYILDICLDYFSTLNPFVTELKSSLGEKKAQLIQRIYCGLCYKDINSLLPHATRLVHRQQFQSVMTNVMKGHLWQSKELFMAEVHQLYSLYSSPQTFPQDFLAFYELLCSSSKDDIEMVVWAGQCLDLPHHESSLDEIDDMMKIFDTFLSTIERPALITIAESKSDCYTPNDQVDSILDKVLALLKARYGDIKVVKHEYE